MLMAMMTMTMKTTKTSRRMRRRRRERRGRRRMKLLIQKKYISQTTKMKMRTEKHEIMKGIAAYNYSKKSKHDGTFIHARRLRAVAVWLKFPRSFKLTCSSMVRFCTPSTVTQHDGEGLRA